MDWAKVVVVTHLFSHRKDLPFPVQVFQVFISYVSHHFIYVLTVHTFVDTSREIRVDSLEISFYVTLTL